MLCYVYETQIVHVSEAFLQFFFPVSKACFNKHFSMDKWWRKKPTSIAKVSIHLNRILYKTVWCIPLGAKASNFATNHPLRKLFSMGQTGPQSRVLAMSLEDVAIVVPSVMEESVT